MASKSKYNEYFIIANNVAACKFCKYTYSMKNASIGTASLKHHLKQHHYDKYLLFIKSEEMKKAESEKSAEQLRNKQISLKRSFAGQSTSAIIEKQPKIEQPRIDNALNDWKKDGDKTKLIHRRIMQMICTDLLPLRFVEKDGFKQLMATIAPQYKLRFGLTYLNILFIKI
jgi:hypothetical protein